VFNEWDTFRVSKRRVQRLQQHVSAKSEIFGEFLDISIVHDVLVKFMTYAKAIHQLFTDSLTTFLKRRTIYLNANVSYCSPIVSVYQLNILILMHTVELRKVFGLTRITWDIKSFQLTEMRIRCGKE
jgi:hypothetical protein